MIDVHAHILPGLDDGVKTPGESVAVLRRLAALGFTHVVATPHHGPGRFMPSAAAIGKALEETRAALTREGVRVELLRGRECLFDFELLSAPERETFPFGWKGRKYQLTEIPDIAPPPVLASYAARLHAEGVIPVFAHAERHAALAHTPAAAEDFTRLGFRIQVDLPSFSRSAPAPLRRTARALLDAGHIHVIASDVHRIGQMDAVEDGALRVREAVGDERMEALCALA